ncbi:type-F conjugative transfer system pilin chaperone TraQ (plasmid) [Escherichia coli]|nr:type-F conjugative transfer system pilin chaperone TraQ [Escherichia coli]WMO97189.1 type-F conjugative transfer system pilin chaperone TraQ [Escherichia coli]
MISKCRFSLPRLDITGMWVFALGVWFHIVARLVYSKPWMAFFLAELIAAILVLFGAYQVLGNDSNLLIVFYVQIMPDDFVMQLHRF